MTKSEFIVSPDRAGHRIDALASVLSGISRSKIHHYIEDGSLTVNHLTVKSNYRARAGDVISIAVPAQSDNGLLSAEDLPLEVLYMDDDLAVVNKPPGMVVYPAAGHSGGTLMNVMAHRSRKLASVGGPLRPGVVHRLDKDTSGVMVVALDDRAYYHLIDQFRKRTIQRRYIALVYGSLKENSGEISLRIGRSESDRKKMSTKTRRGKEAVTTWQVLERFRGATLLTAKLGTGRTHQIRVHFSSVGHPVLGDRTYGKKIALEVNRGKVAFPRQMLHAESLGFIHPSTGEYMEFRAEIPEDMAEPLSVLRAKFGV